MKNKNKEQGKKQAQNKKANKANKPLRYVPIKDSPNARLILILPKDILKEYVRAIDL